jgi:hypothetical protein
MTARPFAILEAPSVLGLSPNGVETLPDALRSAGFAERLGATRAGRVEPPPYNAARDPGTMLLNPGAIASYTIALRCGFCTGTVSTVWAMKVSESSRTANRDNSELAYTWLRSLPSHH